MRGQVRVSITLTPPSPIKAYYVFYVTYLVLAAVGHEALPLFSRTIVLFALPLTVVTLAVVAYRSLRAGR